VSDEHVSVLEQQLQASRVSWHRHAGRCTHSRVLAHGRLTRTLVAAGAGGALRRTGPDSASSASSAASGLTVKGPLKVLGTNGSTILQVDGNGLTYIAGSGGTVPMLT